MTIEQRIKDTEALIENCENEAQLEELNNTLDELYGRLDGVFQ